MLTSQSRLDPEAPTWVAGLDAELVLEMPPTGDDLATCVFNAASPSAVALHALVSADVGMAAKATAGGGAYAVVRRISAGLGSTNSKKAHARFDSCRGYQWLLSQIQSRTVCLLLQLLLAYEAAWRACRPQDAWIGCQDDWISTFSSGVLGSRYRAVGISVMVVPEFGRQLRMRLRGSDSPSRGWFRCGRRCQ